MKKTALLVILIAFSSGCASKPVPFEETVELKYKHSFDFMWDNVISAMRQQYDVEAADVETRTITSTWKTHMAVMSHFGYRTRLVINLEGGVTEGWTVRVKEEKEENTEQVNPLSTEEAEWEPGTADGGTAARFRVALHRRLNPRQDWKENDAR